jgi:hypothetical protein
MHTTVRFKINFLNVHALTGIEEMYRKKRQDHQYSKSRLMRSLWDRPKVITLTE